MAKTIPIIASSETANPAVGTTLDGDGMGCHAGGEKMLAAASAAGKSEVLAQYAKDYPVDPSAGPHDQPQSMCPAFGSLRVGLRMRRTATILSGSACCVYGLTFTSHFYGARRSVGYVPFNSESLVTGKLFEDIRESVYAEADPDKYDAIVIINLCVPTASGVPLQLLPKEINGVRIIGIDVPGFGVPTHAEAKDILAGAMLKYAREEIQAGPVQAPRTGVADKPTITLLGEMFPADPIIIGRMLEPMGLAAGPVVPTREWRELYAALDCTAVAAIHPFYTASIREFGFLNPIIVDGQSGIVAGHGRVMAAQKLGLASLPVIEAAHLTEAQKRAYVIADNRLALDAGWDNDMLKIELQDLDAEGFDLNLTGFNPDEIGNFLAEETEGLTDEDRENGERAKRITSCGRSPKPITSCGRLAAGFYESHSCSFKLANILSRHLPQRAEAAGLSFRRIN